MADTTFDESESNQEGEVNFDDPEVLRKSKGEEEKSYKNLQLPTANCIDAGLCLIIESLRWDHIFTFQR